MTVLQYCTRQVYGNTLYYLADKDQAIQFRGLTGKKTITSLDMTLLTKLTGVTFERVFEPEVTA